MDDNGQLVPEAVTALGGAGLSPAPDPDIYHVTVNVTTRCNLACSYCFQNVALPPSGQPGVPERIPVATVDPDRLDGIFEFIGRQQADRGASKLDLMLFGGEPTLYEQTCLRLLERAGKFGLVNASMVSNGTLFSAKSVQAMAAAGLRSVQITFDGDTAVHDRTRVTVGGRGTFDRIVANLAAVQDIDLSWQLRVNLTAESTPGADALVDRLADRLDPKNFGIYFALVHDIGIGYQDALTASQQLAERVGALYLRAMEAGFEVALPRISHCLTCGETGGGTGAVINSDGVLYSCWDSAGKAGYEVGTVADGYLPNEVISPRWVACGYEAERPAETGYQDLVDARLLDQLYATGRLAAAQRAVS